MVCNSTEMVLFRSHPFIKWTVELSAPYHVEWCIYPSDVPDVRVKHKISLYLTNYTNTMFKLQDIIQG